VKIFHTTNAVFKSLSKYIDGDPRFSGLKRRHRELVNIWVRKELRNLRRCRKHGIPVPMPRANLRNVLVMDLVGNENAPAPRLKDVTIDNVEDVFDKLLTYIAVLWQNATLVHSDFSEFNVLWHEGTPWIIDVGQAVVEQHPSSKEFLVRDVTRTVEWANRNGMSADTAESLLRVIEDPVPNLEPLPGLD
jgi:RIO kinase 1